MPRSQRRFCRASRMRHWPTSRSASRCPRPGPRRRSAFRRRTRSSCCRRRSGGEKVKWIVLDDASDTTRAVTNTRKLISEDKVDVIIGSTVTPNSLAMVDVVADGETPMISMAASARIVDPTNPKTRWVFKVPQNDSLMADAIADAHEGERREDARLHRLQRRLRRELARRDQALGADGRHQGRRRRKIQPQRCVGDRAGAEARRGQSGRDPDRRVRHARARRRRRSSSRAATRARSTRRTASPIPISCASAAPTATARSCRSGRCSCSSSCRNRIRSRRSRRSTSRNTKRNTARTRARRSAAMPTTRSCCCPMRSPKR